MKNHTQTLAKVLSITFCLALCLLANHAQAATQSFWDPKGVISTPYLGDLSGTWESAFWSPNSTGGSATTWSETAGLPAVFAVGAGNGTPQFTVTLNSDHTVPGIVIGGRTSVPYSANVILAGSGRILLPASAISVFKISNTAADSSQGILTINNVIAGTGSQLTVWGTGQIHLDSPNTFNGGFFLGGPAVSGTPGSGPSTNTIYFNQVGSFGTGSITVSNTGVPWASLVLEGSSALALTNPVVVPASTANALDVTGNTAGLTFSGPWTLNSTLNLGWDGAANLVNISGVMGGSGGLTKFGNGTLALTATNTYTGTTTVTNGVLQLGDGSARNGVLGGPIAVTSPGSLVWANATALTNSRVISGTGPVNYQGLQALTLSAANTYAGATTIAATRMVKLGVANALPSGTGKADVSLAGTLDLASFACGVNGLTGAGTVTNSAASTTSTLTVGNNNASSTFSGIIKNGASGTGTNALTKTGSGMLTLSGPNTYSGQTTLSGGTLQVGVDNAIPSGNLVLTSAGTTLDLNGHTETLAYLSGPANIINLNATLNLNGTNQANTTANPNSGSQIYNGYDCLAGPISGSGTINKSSSGTMAVRANSSSFGGTISLTGSGILSVGGGPNWLPTSMALSVPSPANFQLDANKQMVSSLTGNGFLNLGGGVLTVNQSGSGQFDGTIRDTPKGGSPTAFGHGLRGNYYNCIDFSLVSGLIYTVQDDPSVNLDMFTWPGYVGNQTKTNQVSVRWLGQILTTVAGDYVFTTATDDGVRLWVNGVLTVESYIPQGETRHSGTNTLAANTRYDVVMEYYNNAGPGAARLLWTPPGDSTAVLIQSNYLFTPGPGSLVKMGSGTLKLTQFNSYAGSTTVSNGTLEAMASGALGTGPVNVSSGATVQLDNSGSMGAGQDLIVSPSGHVILNLAGGTDNIRALSLDGGTNYEYGGTYGPVGSGADNEDAIFTGNGLIHVSAFPTTTTLTSDPPGTVPYGTTVTLTADISSDVGNSPGGTVSFFDGTNILGTAPVTVPVFDGVASLTVSNLMVINSPHKITAVYSGDLTGDAPSTSNPLSVTTTPASITPVPAIALKLYDGTTTASIAGGSFTGILPDDASYVHIGTNGATASFVTPYVGVNKLVNVSGLSLTGSLAGNYTLSTTSVASTGTISNRTATVSGLNVTTRLYNATTAASLITPINPTLNNILLADLAGVSLAGSPSVAFTTKAAGVNVGVALTGYTITGNMATNYILVLTNLPGTIVATNISVTGIFGNNKVFDGGTTATVGGTPTASYFFPGDDVSINDNHVATFVNPAAGIENMTVTGYSLGGADASDYILSQPQNISGTILQAATTAGIVSSLNPSKVGDNVTFTFTVTSTTATSNAPTGSVTFRANNSAISGAVPLASISAISANAAFSTSTLPSGVVPVTAVYAGDNNFSAPVVPTVNQTNNANTVCSQTNRIMSVTSLGNGSFRLNLLGTYQAQYCLLWQSNVAKPLNNWVASYGSTNIVTNATGLWSFTPTNKGPAFFRVQALSGVCP